MARSDFNDKLYNAAIIGAISYGTYKASLAGMLGRDLQAIAMQIKTYFSGGGSILPPGGGGGGSGRCTIPATGNLAAMQAANPNINQQISNWKTARVSTGENPYDWAAFRQHLMGIQAPDPGGNPPPSFCQ